MTNGEPDPQVVAAVAQVRDSFGLDGLRDLVRLGEQELVRAERAVAELAELNEPQVVPDPGGDEPDTRAWQAYRQAE